MSREVKYIGMDVHKEAIVIAVQNARGHLVMESIEPKPAVFCSLFMDCRANCISPGKKALGRPGCTTCCSPTCTKSWSATRGAMPY